MIKKIEQKPVTTDSHPFATAVNKYGFQIKNYAEDEYFIYGTANLYEECDEGFRVVQQDLDYCNRILVRRPNDTASYSGNIVVEILNPTARVDLDRMWVISGKHFMRRGDIYIGITCKPDVLDALMAFDFERYKDINWGYPHQRDVEIRPNDPALPPLKPDCETGLFWDMLTDLAVLLRKTDSMNPLSAYGDSKIMLTGWSQSACYLWTYVNRLAFDKEYNKGTLLFDGYLAAGGVHKLTIPLNQNGFLNPLPPEYTKIKYMPVPYIAVQTESENAQFGSNECYQPDSNTEELKFRLYEIPGSTHDNKQTLLDYYHNDPDIMKKGGGPKYTADNEFPNDFPCDFPFNAAYEHLFNWVNQNIAPPHCERIQTREDLSNATDQYGNAVGGVRTPFVDVPTCTYVPYSEHNGKKLPLFGHVLPFSPDKLTELYGTIDQYAALVEKSADTAIEKGFLLKEDRDEVIDTAVSSAKQRWHLRDNGSKI